MTERNEGSGQGEATTPPLLPPPPPRPKGKLDVFWDRNWKWFVPALCATGFLVLACFLALVCSAMKFSGAYTGAMERARASPQVAAVLGAPIREGFFVMGNVNTSGPSGSAQLAIPVSGPKGSATIFVDAKETLGEWHFDRLVVQVAGTGGRIDLLAVPDRPYHPPNDSPEPDPPVTR
jgi:Cytochrome oxidase complex assembly protein 1